MLPLLIVLSLAGCDSPGPEFGALPGTMARGARAIELGTGCRIRPGSLSGDPAVIYARLSCAAP